MNRIDEWRASGREVSVAGLGRSGVAAAQLLSHHGVKVYASDAKASTARPVGLPPSVVVEVGRHDLDRIATSAALVLSPGIPPTASVVRTAIEHRVAVIAEAQLGLDALAGVPYIAVTGTNGKTTTTALLDHILRAAGVRSVAAGNIGRPLSAVACEAVRPEWVAAELSSFQLHDMPDVSPTVGVLTNLAPDHLDRYPTLAEYYADKARLFGNARPASIWVTNLDNSESRTMIRDIVGRHLAFTTVRDTRADAWYDRNGDQLMLAGRPLLARADFPLLGDHNVANALAASLALHAAGFAADRIASGLATFRALPHRVEPVRELDGVLWINDSKATNIASTLVAIQAMTRPCVLLLGGRHKGEPYTALAAALRAHATAVVAYGEAGEQIERDLRDVVEVVRAATFDDVMATARGMAPAGGTVLLSPACSSYDMFSNYEERGARFRAIVEGW